MHAADGRRHGQVSKTPSGRRVSQLDVEVAIVTVVVAGNALELHSMHSMMALQASPQSHSHALPITRTMGSGEKRGRRALWRRVSAGRRAQPN